MFSMMPKTTKKLGDALRSGNLETARTEQDTISHVRNRLKGVGIFQAFSEAMNLLGYEGKFSADFMTPVNDEEKELVKTVLHGIEL